MILLTKVNDIHFSKHTKSNHILFFNRIIVTSFGRVFYLLITFFFITQVSHKESSSEVPAASGRFRISLNITVYNC